MNQWMDNVSAIDASSNDHFPTNLAIFKKLLPRCYGNLKEELVDATDCLVWVVRIVTSGRTLIMVTDIDRYKDNTTVLTAF